MGNLVDTYILCPKYEVDKKGYRDNFIDRNSSVILSMVENETDKSLLAEVFKLDCQIVDLFVKTAEMPENVWAVIERYESEHTDWRFARRYRQDSFLQRIRKLFFNTLLVVENDYDGDKQNHFIIVRSDDLIFIKPMPKATKMSDAQFSNSGTEDEEFCRTAITEITGGENEQKGGDK